MMKKLLHMFGCLLLLAGVTDFALAQGKIEFSLNVVSASGVSIGEQDAKKGDVINEDNVGDVDFEEGSSLVVVNNDTGIKYRLANLADLEFLGNALATSTNGVAIGRWVVGGHKSVEGSTLISTGATGETPAATKKEPEPQQQQSASPAPNVKPASTPAAQAASPVGP